MSPWSACDSADVMMSFMQQWVLRLNRWRQGDKTLSSINFQTSVEALQLRAGSDEQPLLSLTVPRCVAAAATNPPSKFSDLMPTAVSQQGPHLHQWNELQGWAVIYNKRQTGREELRRCLKSRSAEVYGCLFTYLSAVTHTHSYGAHLQSYISMFNKCVCGNLCMGFRDHSGFSLSGFRKAVSWWGEAENLVLFGF